MSMRAKAVFARFLNTTMGLANQRGAWREATAGRIVEAVDPCCENGLGRSRVLSLSAMRCIGWSRHYGGVQMGLYLAGGLCARVFLECIRTESWDKFGEL